VRLHRLRPGDPVRRTEREEARIGACSSEKFRVPGSLRGWHVPRRRDLHGTNTRGETGSRNGRGHDRREVMGARGLPTVMHPMR
jgi:hypothetical protein